MKGDLFVEAVALTLLFVLFFVGISYVDVPEENRYQPSDNIYNVKVTCIEGYKWIASPAYGSFYTLAGPLGECNER